MESPFLCIYRHLGKSTKTKTVWSIVGGRITKAGYADKGKGPRSFEGGLMMSNVITNPPGRIATGCRAILRNWANPNTTAGREVIAYVGGKVERGMPTGKHLGTLTLDIDAGCFVVRAPDGSTSPFNPEGVQLAFNRSCEVYLNA